MTQADKKLLLLLLSKAREEGLLHIYDYEDNIYMIDWLFEDGQNGQFGKICMAISEKTGGF